MIFKNYYQIMGVSEDATLDQIKKQYRKLAFQYHPDKNPGNKAAEEKFKEIAEAFAVLSDPQKRTTFDEFLGKKKYYDYQQSSQASNDYSSSYSQDYDYSDLYDSPYSYQRTGRFSEFFNQFFSRRQRTNDRYREMLRGEDIKGKISIDLEEAYIGSTRILTVEGEKLRLQLKPGVENDQLLKIKGKGKHGYYEGERGDLYVRIVLKPHHIFRREKNNLHRDIHIDLFTAVVGGVIKVLTFKDEREIALPPQVANGKVFKLKGYGMPDYNNPTLFGDLYVTIKYDMPKDLRAEDKELLRSLSERYKKSVY